MTLSELSDVSFTILRKRPILAALIFLAALSIFTVWLSATYYTTRAARSGDYFIQGRSLELAGEVEAAADYYRDALTLDRDSIEFRQALVRVLVQLDRIGEAETHLVELIQQRPMGGESNLMLARIAWDRGDLLSADNYYQRAIYGLWPESPLQRKQEVRFEFVERLIGAGRENRALVELLQLTEELPHSHPDNLRIARTMLQLEAPREASQLMDAVTQARPDDASAWLVFGEALIAGDSVAEAEPALRHALGLSPNSVDIQRTLQTARSILTLDPHAKGLRDRERVSRSRSLTDRALTLINSCAARYRIALNVEEQNAVENAAEFLQIPAPRALPEDAADRAIRIAGDVSRVLQRVCTHDDIEPGMRVVMERLAP